MAIGSGVTVTRLSAEEERKTGFTHACTINQTALVQSGTATISNALAILDVGVGDVVDKAAYVIIEPWDASDASLNSVTIKIGDGSDDDRYMVVTGTQLAEDGTEVDYWHSTTGTTAPFAYTSADTVDAIFTVAGGADPTIDEINAGKVVVLLRVYSLKDLVGRDIAGS